MRQEFWAICLGELRVNTHCRSSCPGSQRGLLSLRFHNFRSFQPAHTEFYIVDHRWPLVIWLFSKRKLSIVRQTQLLCQDMSVNFRVSILERIQKYTNRE